LNAEKRKGCRPFGTAPHGLASRTGSALFGSQYTSGALVRLGLWSDYLGSRSVIAAHLADAGSCFRPVTLRWLFDLEERLIAGCATAKPPLGPIWLSDVVGGIEGGMSGSPIILLNCRGRRFHRLWIRNSIWAPGQSLALNATCQGGCSKN
jgi:hypothetical protein